MTHQSPWLRSQMGDGHTDMCEDVIFALESVSNVLHGSPGREQVDDKWSAESCGRDWVGWRRPDDH